METRNIFLNISPLDHRYSLSEKTAFDELSRYLSEEAGIRYCIFVECALLKALINLDNGLNDKPRLAEEIGDIVKKIDPQEVYDEEARTHHNIRALVNVIKNKVPEKVRHLVHLGATSQDILDTAHSMRIRDTLRKVVLPLLVRVEETLIGLTEKNAETPQIGRTHGQYAVPITFGFALSSFVSRLGKSIEKMFSLSNDLRGKLSGAVGAYNATSLITGEPETLESRVLEECGLKPSEHATQIIESEYLLRLLLEMNIAFGIVANLADDLRNLQRSEIGEIREAFTKDQVGSSTMPQKRNPWNSEHIKSLWKAFAPRVMTFFMDQISEHQRDLTNSASARFIADFIAGFTAAAQRLLKVLSSLSVNPEIMKDNLEKAGEMALAEPVYILLSLGGEPDAHEIVRKLTLACEKEGKRLVELLESDEHVWEIIKSQLAYVGISDPHTFFSETQRYRGKAVEKAITLAHFYRSKMESINKAL
ncbi:MAG: adenylosuccinate lyase [Spirochaetales bacterium]|nr:adenylosuccinate lyase [Spirochaetales bacterium]